MNKFKIFCLILILGVVSNACNQAEEKENEVVSTTYTCPMHPQIVQDKPGSCPICGMDLVVFDRTNKDRSLTLHESQITLANITTAIAGDTSLSNRKTLNGRLAINPEKTVYVSSRVAGRIDVLPIRETGIKVSKGQQLFGIFSEELAALQQEYIVTVAQVEQFPNDDKFREIEKGARQKLLLYGQTAEQVTRIKQTRKTNPYVTFASPVNGIVAELSVTQGQYVNEGDAIMRVENYDQLWVEADLYPSEAAALKIGQMVNVDVAASGEKPFKMKIEFITPNIEEGSQVLQVRGTINNHKNVLQPGMQALINVPFGNRQQVITLPAGAVIRDGDGTHAWVQVAKGKFEPRAVKTGTENANEIEIVQGIEEGERVVVTGAYLLYSEYILKKGNDPVATHNH